jgi:hypothetical protein
MKDLCEFAWKNKDKNKKMSCCKNCYNNKYGALKRKVALSYKIGLKCQICGEDHPATIVFHHRDPTKKKWPIARGIADGYSKEIILEEMDKCDVLCANCHHKLHWGVSVYD